MIEYHLTPWDAKSFGFKTAEITISKTSNFETDSFKNKLSKILDQLEKEKVKFVYSRIPSSNFELRKTFQKLGFYFAEVSQKISKNKIHKYIPLELPKLKLVDAKDSDLIIIQEIARDSFGFSRFHEDVQIPLEKSKKRYTNWVKDLFEQKVILQKAMVGEKVVGINIQKINEEKQLAELILCGCIKGAELYVMSLWNEILKYNKTKGVKKVNTLISASNINIANLYASLDFKITETLLGFHKFIN